MTRVVLGGQNVQVRVHTTEVSGLQAQASAEAALVTIAANRVAAELAETNAETAETNAEAAAATAAADAAATAADRATVDALVDEAAAYVSAIPPDQIYETDAAGRTGVGVDGAFYWLTSVNGLRLRVRSTSSTSADVTVSSIPIIAPSVRYLGANQGVVRLEYLSGSASNNYALKVSNPNILLSGTGTVPIFEWISPFDCNGNHNVSIYQNDGVTLFLGLTQVQAPDGGTPALDSFAAGDWMRAVRVPSPVGDYPGDANELLQLAAPNTAVKQVSKGFQTLDYQTPSRNYTASITRIDEKNYAVKTCSVEYETAADAMDTDHVVWIMKDLSAAMSLGATTCASAFALNSDVAEINGRKVRYSQFLSNELPGGNWTREQPSTTEPVDRVGPFGNPVNDFHLVGLNHAGYMGNTTGDLSLTMDGVEIELEIGETKDGDEIIFSQRFDVYRDNGGSPLQNGECTITHTFNENGCTIFRENRVGRALAFDAGLIEIEVGDTIVGATSGAIGVVQSIPARQFTGTWGSTAAGTLHISLTSGTFQDNETLNVGGVAHATVNGTLGAQIGVQNAYGVLACFTTINRMKMAGIDALTVGTADGTQRPTAADIAAGRTWAVPAATFDGYHTNNMDADGVGPIRRLVIANNSPMTPPGDYSLCQTTKAFLEDRNGGNRKIVINWCSGEGTSSELYEGTRSSEYTINYVVGSPVA